MARLTTAAITLKQIRAAVALVRGARAAGDRRLLQTAGGPPPRQHRLLAAGAHSACLTDTDWEHPAGDPGHAPDWLLLDRELSTEPQHTDSVILLYASIDRSEAPVLHLEFQTRPHPLMAERMLDNWIRLHCRYRRPVRQVVLHLRPTRSPLARIEHLAIGRTRHHFNCVRLSGGAPPAAANSWPA